MRKVLVAEDEVSIREFIVINLERAGYTVQQADDGAQALRLFEAQGGDFDVVILDIMMPQWYCWTLCSPESMAWRCAVV